MINCLATLKQPQLEWKEPSQISARLDYYKAAIIRLIDKR